MLSYQISSYKAQNYNTKTTSYAAKTIDCANKTSASDTNYTTNYIIAKFRIKKNLARTKVVTTTRTTYNNNTLSNTIID